MKLLINGEFREIEPVETLPELIDSLGLSGAALLVEHNGVALHRSEWSECSLKAGDQLEFLRIAAGG